MKPRILMAISQFYPRLGGAEQQALRLAEALRALGLPVSVLTRHIAGLPEREAIQGVPVHRRIRAYPGTRLFSIAYLLSALWFFLQRRATYDIIHCHIAQGFHSPAALICKALHGKKVDIKVAATGLLSDFHTLASVRFGPTILHQLRRADKIICPCAQAAQEARAAGVDPTRIALLPHGVDTGFFVPAAEPGSRTNIVFVGRLDYMKGVHVLLHAAHILQQRGTRYHLRIIGDGPERKNLEALAQHLGLADAVLFAGELADVRAQLQRAAVFVLPSLSEGLSNVILEAMACALPVVATRAGGNPDLIQDRITGVLVAPEQPGELAEALAQLLSDQDLARRLGSATRMRVLEAFSITSVATQDRELYTARLKDRAR